MRQGGTRGAGAAGRAGIGLLLCGLLALPLAGWAAKDECAGAVAPQRCQAHLQGLRSCLDLPEAGRRGCLAYYTPPLGCQRQRDARRCEALMAAQSSCEGMLGAPRRACVDERLPPAACSARGGQPCAADDAACAAGRRDGCRRPAPPLDE
ncbi:Uncharacterised protein [Chromobacterium violaceum]|uniref:Cysteine rich repeat n=1 Tax=Chromobacterium violaceum TaxID=536 RepID=A0AAX2MFM7_CHRVL|nr:Uncharacterised protein [Chromobacterium violaceum]SUX35045.1 Uncharacterised protein [Chromobacterium violaceum]